MNQFGGRALGMAAQENRRLQEAGVDTLYGQKLGGPGGLTERSFGASFKLLGVNAPELAKIAAGSTNEEANKEAEIRDLAGVLPDLGKAMVAASTILKLLKIQEAAAAEQYECCCATSKSCSKRSWQLKNVDSEVNTKVANINTGKVSESGDTAGAGAKDGAGGGGGGGGGGIMGAIKGIFGSGGVAVAEAGNMARNAINIGKILFLVLVRDLKVASVRGMFPSMGSNQARVKTSRILCVRDTSCW